jgi:hypothetical protein
VESFQGGLVNNKGRFGADVGKEHVERLREYLHTLRTEGKPLPARDGRPNLSAIALACGFGRWVFYDNSAARELLERFAKEFGLEEKDGAPEQEVDTEKRLLKARILQLEQRNAALKAENDGLRRKLKQYAHIEEHMIETGRRVIP